MSELEVPNDGVLTTRTEKVWLGDDGILRAVVAPGLVTTLDDAKENVLAFGRAGGGTRRLCVIDMRAHAASATRDAREYYAGPENAKVTIATAMLIGSAVGRVIGNFLIQVNRPSFPLRLFSQEAEAVAWLEEIRRQSRI